MRIKASVGQASQQTVGNITYDHSQKTDFLYVITQDKITNNNYEKVMEERAVSNVPHKLPYADTNASENSLIGKYPKDGLILMNYNAGGRITDDIYGYRQYGLMTVPRSDYVNAISVYKKEIWYNIVNGVPVSAEENNWHLVTNISDSGTIFDFNVANNRYYKYLFRFVYSGESEESGDTNDVTISEELKEIIIPVKVSWKGWTLTELHEVGSVDSKTYGDKKVYNASLRDVWKFKYNISPGDITQELSKTVQETMSKFPKFVNGPKDVKKGQVSCLLGRDVEPFNWQTISYAYGKDSSGEWGWTDVYTNFSGGCQTDSNTQGSLYGATDNSIKVLNDTYAAPFHGYPQNAGGYNEGLWSDKKVYYADLTSNKKIDMLNHWQAFCYSGNPKLLKDQTGNKYIVQIHDPSSHIEESWEKRPITISFSWTQIDDADNCEIIQEED